MVNLTNSKIINIKINIQLQLAFGKKCQLIIEVIKFFFPIKKTHVFPMFFPDTDIFQYKFLKPFSVDNIGHPCALVMTPPPSTIQPAVSGRPDAEQPPSPERLLCCCRFPRGRIGRGIQEADAAQPCGGVSDTWNRASAVAVTDNSNRVTTSADSQSGFHSNLLWEGLIHGPVHTHGHPQGPQATVLPDPTQDGGQAGGHQIGGPEGHYGADVLNSNAVLRRRHQIEVCEDLVRVLQPSFVPGVGRKESKSAYSAGVCVCVCVSRTGLLVHGCHVGRGDGAFSPQGVRHVSVEEQSQFGHLQQHQPDQLPQIHPAHHLLEA